MKTKKVIYIGNKLANKGKNPTSIDNLSKLFEKDGISVITASDKSNKLFRLFEMIFKTLWYGRKVDVVIIDTYSTTNFWYAFLVSQICRILNVKYMLKLEGGNLSFRLANNPYFSKLIFKYAYKLIAPTNYMYSIFKKDFGDNLKYLPNALPIEKYPFKNREFKCNDTLSILWVRALSPIYNPTLAIKSASMLKENFKTVKLTMIGPYDYENYEQCLSLAKKLEFDVEITGKLSKEEWIEKSKEYDIFLNTSSIDNAPVSILEAMALGLPVFSSNTGGIANWIENGSNGYLINNIEDPQAYADVITDAFKNKNNLIKVAVEARKTVEYFDWNRVKVEWLNLIEKANQQ